MTLHCPNCGRGVLLSDGEWEAPVFNDDGTFTNTFTIPGSIRCGTCEAVSGVLLYPCWSRRMMWRCTSSTSPGRWTHDPGIPMPMP